QSRKSGQGFRLAERRLLLGQSSWNTPRNRDARGVRNRDGLHRRVRHANRFSRRLRDRPGGRFRYRLRHPDGLRANMSSREAEPEVRLGVVHAFGRTTGNMPDVPRDFYFVIPVSANSHIIPTTQLNLATQRWKALTAVTESRNARSS